MDARRSKTSLLEEAKVQFAFSQAVRRDLHRHPELGFQEYRTSKIVAAELEKLGYQVKTGLANTGVVGELVAGQNGKTVLLRFDMDALPVQEQNEVSYASTCPGLMHACGHDGHVAIGLTVARLLAARRADLQGSVRLLFQPAEEGLGGAARMVADGALGDPLPEACLAMHVWNDRPYGWAAIHSGPLMAGSDVFELVLHGQGGHGALPENTIDPVLAGAQVVTALQSIVSRNISPLLPAVVSVTQFHAGDAFNVIPPSARLGGTIRTFEPEVRAQVLQRFETIVQSTAAAYGCRAELKILAVTPAVINDEAVSSLVEEAAAAVFPELSNDRSYRTTVSEDMAELFERVPGCYILVGSAPQPPAQVYGHHHPRFDIDEQVLPLGAAMMAAAAERILAENINA